MSGHVPAPGLRETAEVWWDAAEDPLVCWDDAGRTFVLRDPADDASVLVLWTAPEPVADPHRLATALAEGLAACDFPPTGHRADPARTAAALRAAGLGV